MCRALRHCTEFGLRVRCRAARRASAREGRGGKLRPRLYPAAAETIVKNGVPLYPLMCCRGRVLQRLNPARDLGLRCGGQCNAFAVAQCSGRCSGRRNGFAVARRRVIRALPRLRGARRIITCSGQRSGFAVARCSGRGNDQCIGQCSGPPAKRRHASTGIRVRGFGRFRDQGSRFRALLGSRFEVLGASGIRVRGFGRSWDQGSRFRALLGGRRKKFVFPGSVLVGRCPKPLHFCLTSFFTFAISGRISSESTCARFWDSGSKFCALLGFGFEGLGVSGIRVRDFKCFWD